MFSEFKSLIIRTRSTTTRDRNLQFRGIFSTGSFESSPVDFFPFSPGLLCSLVRKSPQNVEKFARLPGGEKGVESCHVSGCHGFFRSRTYPKGPKIEKIQDRPPGLKFSSEIENFKRASHQTPIFVGNSRGRD